MLQKNNTIRFQVLLRLLKLRRSVPTVLVNKVGMYSSTYIYCTT